MNTHPRCDSCGESTGPDYCTDDEVCQGGDGPGFFLCSRPTCTRRYASMNVEERRSFFALGRAAYEARGTPGADEMLLAPEYGRDRMLWLVFAGKLYYPRGGWCDFRGAFTTEILADREAKDVVARERFSPGAADWAHVVRFGQKAEVIAQHVRKDIG